MANRCSSAFSLYSLWTKSVISHQIFDNSRIFHSWFFQAKTVGHSFAWTRQAFSHESESKAYYLDDEEFLLPSCIHLMKPPHLLDPPLPKKHGISRQRGDRCFFKRQHNKNGSFFVLKTTKRFACWVQCHQTPWIAAQEPLSPIRHEDKRSERQGRFGCFARGHGHGYFSLAVFAEVG